MLKTISAALLAVSVLAAPALRCRPDRQPATKTTQAPVIKAEHAEAKRAECQCPDGRITTGITAIIATTSTWARSRRTALEGRDQAHSRRQARLN